MTEETTRDFLARLWQLKLDAKMSNVELARHLGCSPSYISHLRRGRPGKGSQVGLEFALNAARLFPELRSFLLPSELLVSNNVVPDGNEETEQ